MKRFSCGLFIVLVASSINCAQRAADQIASIQRVNAAANAQIEEMQKAPEFSSVFAAELIVNKHLSPYPAVGIFQVSSTFYYTYGDREKNPYPDRLIKITTVYRRSSRVESGEFYFNPAGQLVYALVKNEEGAIKESRLYYSAGRLIKMTDDGKVIGLTRQRALEAGRLVKREGTRLAGIFRASLIEDR